LNQHSSSQIVPVIEVKNLFVDFGKQNIIENISFDINSGEIVTIIGPNGAGKTTLMKAMLGLIPYRGEIKILNKKIEQVLDEISYVPQKFEFDKTFPLTIEELLSYSQKKKSQEIIDSVLYEVDMFKYKKSLIGQLSGGQLQRVLIAKALLNNAKILFLDEATAGVDKEGEKSFYQLIEHLNKYHNSTIILISHEINIVYKHATKVICLNKELLCCGAPKEKITKELLEKLYSKDMELRNHHH